MVKAKIQDVQRELVKGVADNVRATIQDMRLEEGASGTVKAMIQDMQLETGGH